MAWILAFGAAVTGVVSGPSADVATNKRSAAVPLSMAGLDGVLDPAGRPRDPFAGTNHSAVVLIFINIDCPVCNRYAPEIQRLETRFAPSRVKFWLVQTDAEESLSRTRKHLQEFGYDIDLLRDTRGALVRLSKAAVTPEAAVFDSKGQLVYHGRIDNRFADFGKARPTPTRRELQDALESLLAGKPVSVPHEPAVGCTIPPLTR